MQRPDTLTSQVVEVMVKVSNKALLGALDGLSGKKKKKRLVKLPNKQESPFLSLPIQELTSYPSMWPATDTGSANLDEDPVLILEKKCKWKGYAAFPFLLFLYAHRRSFTFLLCFILCLECPA